MEKTACPVQHCSAITWKKKKPSVSACENSRQFAPPPLVSPRNGVRGTSAEILNWWRVTTQFRLVEADFQPIRRTIQTWVMSCHRYGITALVSPTLFRGKTSCWLFSQATGVLIRNYYPKPEDKCEVERWLCRWKMLLVMRVRRIRWRNETALILWWNKEQEKVWR